METFPQLLIHQAETRARSPAVRVKQLGLWNIYSWGDLANRVQSLANGFMDMGIRKGDKVIMVSDNTPEVVLMSSALQVCGVIAVPLNANASDELLAYVIKSLNIQYAYAHDQQQVDMLLAAQDKSIKLKKIFYAQSRGLANYDKNLLQDIEAVCAKGDEYSASHPDAFRSAVDATKTEDTAFIFLSSGTSSEPKLVPLSYANILHIARYIVEVENITEDDGLLSFVPIAMPASFIYGQAASFLCGFCVSYPESSETVLENLREIGPTLLFASAHVYKYLATLIHNRITFASKLTRRLYNRYYENAPVGETSLIGSLLITEPIKNVYGFSHLRVAATSGDAISEKVFNSFRKLGINIKQIYGCAETGGVIAMQTAQEKEAHSVGHTIAGSEIKIAADGEILCKGPNIFKAYTDGTSDTIDDEGWFHTGDLGMIEGNELYVKDRKELVKDLGGGKKLMPKIIENRIKSSPYIQDAYVWSPDDTSVCALIVADEHTVGYWAEYHDVRYTGYQDLVSQKEVEELITAQLKDATDAPQTGSEQAPLQHFVLLKREFSATLSELTWTNKLCRHVIEKNFSAILNGIKDKAAMIKYNDPITGADIDYKVCRL
ncbi:MAG: AMP-binding protein [Chromatiales bacterium]|nr:AMP-binding protein [Chromatiales bacterium]